MAAQDLPPHDRASVASAAGRGEPILGSGASETGGVESAVAPPRECTHPLAPSRTREAADQGFNRLAPLAIATALFMEFFDSTALSTALPTLARAFHSDPVHLKAALTAYLLALAVGAPAGGWLADKLGARRVFLSAMAVFLAGSALCGLSHSLGQLVCARLIQGLGGAMMTPVGRIIVVASAPRARLVSAIAWFTTPALVGPLIGPPLAGLILGVASWPWIFFVNIPVGVLGMVAVRGLIPNLRQPDPGPFDTRGFLLVGVAITLIVVLAETVGVDLIAPSAQVALAAGTALALAAFALHARRTASPVLQVDLLRSTSFRASVAGSTLVRLGVGATPFLTPLLLQLGFGWSPVKSGLVSIATALGAMSMRPIVREVIRRVGFRTLLMASGVAAALLTAAPGMFRAWTPVWAMFAVMFLGGAVRSTQFISSNTLAYADVAPADTARASTLATVVQQVGMSLGVSLGALTLHLARGRGALTAQSFTLPFLLIGGVTLLALPIYRQLSRDAGAQISGHAERRKG